MRSLFSTLLVVALAGFTAGACQMPPAADDVGEIKLAVAAGPPEALCLRITVVGLGAGTSTVRSLSLRPGTSTAASIGGLPIGNVDIRAEAFAQTCGAVTASSIPTWVSDPASAFLVPGVPTPVTLEMERAGQINVRVDWNTGGAPGGVGGSGVGGSGVGGSGAGGAGGLAQVAAPLNGQMLLMPCLVDTQAAVCATARTACPLPNPTDPALSGVHMTDKLLTLGGTPGTLYTITLHVQGEVEAKQYVNSVDQESLSTSPAADGFAVGGTPTTSNAYGVYMIRVTNPGTTASTDYFLNSLQPPGVSNHTTYGVDYVARIQAQGGATVRLVAADSNCSQIKNCGPTVNDGNTCAAPIILPNVDPVAVASNPTFNFNTAYNGQWLSLVVTGVTSP